MKKIYPVMLLLLLMSLGFYTCKKDYSPGDAVDDKIKLDQQALKDSMVRDSLRKLSGVIYYSVNIVDGSDAGFSMLKSTKSAASIKNTKVIAVQYGKTFVINDSAGLGIVTFKDLRIGTVSVKVEAQGFTECSYIAQLFPITGMDTIAYSATHSDVWNLVRYVGTMIPLFPTTGDKMATVSGVVTYESDLTNAAAEKAANVDVFGVIDVTNDNFIAKYMASYEDIGLWGGDNRPEINYYGHIVKIAYNSIVFKGTTDAIGAYTVKVPATGDGLPIRMEISDVAVDQKLLMNTLNDSIVHGVQSVRTLFSSNYTPSTIPSVASAYCTFSAPSGTGTSNQPTTAATATAIVSESGIVSLTVNNPGLGYTQAPKVVITGAGSISPASATAVLGTDGRVSDITLDVPGLGYTTATVSFSGSETQSAIATPIVTYSVDKVNLTAGGTYTSSTAPAVNIYSNSGTGATAVANMSGSVTTINVSAGGTGYTVAPLVVFSGGNPQVPASATANLTGDAVTSITITSNGSGYTSVPTISLQSVNGVGSGATASATVNYTVSSITITNAGLGYRTGDARVVIAPGTAQATGTVDLTKGVLSGLIVSTPGAGYTAAPNVNISGGGASVNATATATIANGQVTGFNITNPGAGYTADPTVTINTFKTAATATAVCNSMAGKIIAINLTGNGEGYQAIPIVEFYYPNANGTTTGNGNGTKATATATINTGRVTDVAITDGGTGYFTAPLVRFRMPNVNQIAKATLTVSNDGYITGITLDNGGWGYESIPTITISPSVSGKGSGASAIVTKMDNSQVTAVKIVNQGTGYMGKNSPAAAKPFSMITAGAASNTSINNIPALTGKSYIRDIYLGTGKRTIEQ